MNRSILLTLMILAGTPVHSMCNPDAAEATPMARFVDNGDETMTDSATGLMWKRCSEGLSGPDCAGGAAAIHSWQQALQRAQEVNDGGGFAGYSDWRVPSEKELTSIAETRCFVPAINETVFPGTVAAAYWTSSPYANDADHAWVVLFTNGHGYTNPKGRDGYLRLVRGGR